MIFQAFNKNYITFFFLATVFFFLGSIYKVPYKFFLKYLYQNEYADLVYKCDYVMKNHYIAKAKVIHKPSAESLGELELAEIALIDCQIYDKLRKKLIFLGLNENDLSYIGLEAIEKKSADIMEIIEIHEIKE